MGEAPTFFLDHLENGYTNGFGLKSEPKNRDTSVQIGDRSYVIGGNHEGNPLFLGVQIHDIITNKWYSPTVLGTGPKPCKSYSANVLEKGRRNLHRSSSITSKYSFTGDFFRLTESANEA